MALAHIKAHPGITVHELLATYPDLPVDVLWVLLSARRAFTDLSATLLMNHDQVSFYAEEEQVLHQNLGEPVDLTAPLQNLPVAWDGRLWRIEALANSLSSVFLCSPRSGLRP